MTSKVLTRFFFDLAWWPMVVFFLPKWPSFEFNLEIINKHSTCKIHDYFKNVTSRVLTRFTLIWPDDLVFDHKWPSFWAWPRNHQTNILSMIYDEYFKYVNLVLTSFSFDLAWWSSFWPLVTQFGTWPWFHIGKHSEQVSLIGSKLWHLEC